MTWGTLHLALLNKRGAARINNQDIEAICRVMTTLPDRTSLVYPFPYLQFIFLALLSGESHAGAYARRLLDTMQAHFSREPDAPDRDAILGEIIVISRTMGFGSFEGDAEPLETAAKLLGGKPADTLDPADPFTFGLPMLLHSEFMRAGTLDEAVERCQYNAYELVTDGFGRGSEKLIRAEAALLRCQFDTAKLLAKQASLDAADKKQYFIMASASSVLMRRALFLGDTEEAADCLSDIQNLIPTAIRAYSGRRITIVMLREVFHLAECFFYTSMKKEDDIPADFLDGSHRIDMTGGLGVPQVYMARAMAVMGNFSGALRLCESLSRLKNVCQCARLYGLILSALCREHFYGEGSGLVPMQKALREGEQDGILLPFAETPDILPIIKKCYGGIVSEDYIERIRRQCEAYRFVVPTQIAEHIPKLSEREREVLRLTATGKSRAEVAALLCVQENTVKAQLSAAYKKLNAKGKTEAIRLAKTYEII